MYFSTPLYRWWIWLRHSHSPGPLSLELLCFIKLILFVCLTLVRILNSTWLLSWCQQLICPLLAAGYTSWIFDDFRGASVAGLDHVISVWAWVAVSSRHMDGNVSFEVSRVLSNSGNPTDKWAFPQLIVLPFFSFIARKKCHSLHICALWWSDSCKAAVGITHYLDICHTWWLLGELPLSGLFEILSAKTLDLDRWPLYLILGTESIKNYCRDE